jgi:hypothetical protein
MNEPPSPSDRVNRLERRANVVRSRLLRTIDVLDARRHHAADVGGHAPVLAAETAGIVAIAVAGIVGVRHVVLARRARRDGPLAGLVRGLRRERRPSFLSEALRKVVISVACVVAAELARRLVRPPPLIRA